MLRIGLIKKLIINPVTYIFLVIFLVVFWNIGSYPYYFDSCVEHAIHLEVDKLFDGADVSNQITWLWTDMHQHGAGRSPIYSGIIGFGLNLFGLTLFSVRIIPAIIAYLTLILVYFTMKKVYPQKLTLIFIILMSSSPLYLMMTRSGAVIGLTLSMVFISLCLIYYMKAASAKDTDLQNNIWLTKAILIIIPFIAGISVAILPYGYNIIRPLPIFLIIYIIILAILKKIDKVSLTIFLIPIIIVVLIQFKDANESFNAYFNARGESLFATMRQDDVNGKLSIVFDKVKENAIVQLKYLFGVYNTENFWNPKIADSFWRTDIVFYPRFLVPFFLLGFISNIIRFIKEKKAIYVIPVLLLVLTAIPGLMAGVGTPNTARDYIMIIPIYYFIAYSIYVVYSWLAKNDKDIVQSKKQNKKLKYQKDQSSIREFLVRYLSWMPVALVIFAFIFQSINFYQQNNPIDFEYRPAFQTYEFLQDYFAKNSEGRVLLHESPPFGNYSYVNIKWLGGKSYEDKIKSKQIVLLRNENIFEVQNLYTDGYFDKIITSVDDITKDIIVDLKERTPELYKDLKIYNLK